MARTKFSEKSLQPYIGKIVLTSQIIQTHFSWPIKSPSWRVRWKNFEKFIFANEEKKNTIL